MMAGRSFVPIFHGCRSIHSLRRTFRRALQKRLFSNGAIPPLNEPLPNMPAPAPDMVCGADWQNRHDHVTHVTTLDNGIKVASEDSFGQFSTVGVVIDAGSRYEVDYPSGLSHLLEKLAFQSTVEFQSNDDIMQELEKFGGMADCSSFRDAIIYGTSCFTSGLPTVMKVLSQAVFQPQLTDQEIEEQKMVVQFELENLEMRPDPEPVLTDLIHAAAFRDNTVGLPKLCPPENIGKFNSTILQDYMKRYYQPSRIVIAGVNVDHQHLADLTNDYFVNKPPMWQREGEATESPDRSIAQYTGGIVKVFWNTPGHLLSSYVNVMCIDFQLRDLTHVIVKEYFTLINGPINEVEVARAKKQLQSMLMMNLESRVIVFEDIGRQVLGLHKRKSAQELFQSIENVTVDDIKRVSSRMLASKPSVAALGNLTNLPKFEEIERAFCNRGTFSGASRFFLFRN
ncbi:mitochondrial-processing peptidase subunit alpha-like [Orbicella faveolata]|uniref:mitochondrial-processing peptidase subunit alpha-like n=1 Tax=Orbicella faveolata TaxID=48498 RepID=UPI0009E2BACA|nr:mitochondrial-processing peptidase subunit alpha-like [Orbicella faveolata]